MELGFQDDKHQGLKFHQYSLSCISPSLCVWICGFTFTPFLVYGVGETYATFALKYISIHLPL